MSVLRTGRGVQVGGEVEFLTEKKNSLRNVPGVFFFPTKFFGGGGGDFGVFGAPHAPTRGSSGVGKQYTYDHDHDM